MPSPITLVNKAAKLLCMARPDWLTAWQMPVLHNTMQRVWKAKGKEEKMKHGKFKQQEFPPASLLPAFRKAMLIREREGGLNLLP